MDLSLSAQLEKKFDALAAPTVQPAPTIQPAPTKQPAPTQQPNATK
jgi:hypothetical protein